MGWVGLACNSYRFSAHTYTPTTTEVQGRLAYFLMSIKLVTFLGLRVSFYVFFFSLTCTKRAHRTHTHIHTHTQFHMLCF